MATVLLRRSARRPAPEIPSGELRVGSPPEIPQVVGARWQQLMMVLPMLGGGVAMAMLMGRGGGAYSYVVGAVFGVSSLAMLASWSGAGAPKKAEMMAARRDYLRHLAGLRRRVRDTIARQRAGLAYRHPEPGQLWSTVSSHRLWERRATDPDFGVVRVGAGPQALATPLVPPVTGTLDDLEPMTAGALRRFLDAYSVVPDLPVALSLRGFARVYVRGDASALVRAMVVQLAVFHAPDDLRIAVCAGPERRAAWEWVKWLPHAQHPARTDALGPVRLVAGAGQELERLLSDVVGSRPRFAGGSTRDGPHVVVVLDGATWSQDGGIDGVSILDLDGTPPRLLDPSTLVLSVSEEGRLVVDSGDGPAEVGRADGLGVVEAEAVARRLAPYRLAAPADPDEPPATAEPLLAELLGLGDLDKSPPPRAARDRLRVPIGVTPAGRPVELDLKESAQDGMGPHGLLVGATGSGKSELLRTLVLGLAATHSSEELNFVLVDYKGGATFAALDRLPHTAAVITNLAKELPLVDRMVDALNGEIVRRQELLRRAGISSIREYEKGWARGLATSDPRSAATRTDGAGNRSPTRAERAPISRARGLATSDPRSAATRADGAGNRSPARAERAPISRAPLPYLLVVCDEFAELLAAKPDFIELFLQIGRLGRSLGVHLLLASQRLEEGRLRGLDTHLSYRIGLRTFSALESRSVLGVPDAYELPRSPGHGLLKAGTEPLVRFKAAYVSGPFRRPGDRLPSARAGRPRVLPYGTHYVPAPNPATPPAESGPSLLELLVERLAGQGPPAHRVWLPPLSRPPALDELLGPVAADPARGLTVANPDLRGALQVPVAVIDNPFEQRRDVLWLALDGAAGHVAVAGGPQSGKSTVVRTLICGLALTHTPTEVRVYCLDFGGGSLAALRDLPHVGGVAGRLDAEAVRRTVGDVAATLAEREAGAPADGDVFLVVDGWATLRGEYEDLEPMVTGIATRGLSYGVHVVAAASRWLDFRPPIRDLFGSRVELRLGDPTDSIVSRQAALSVPEKVPGRGVTPEGRHLLTALPALSALGRNPGLASSGPRSAATRAERASFPGPPASEASASSTAPAALVRAVAAGWAGPPAPRVRLLPPVLPYAELDLAGAGLRIPIGIAEADLRPVDVDFASDPHLLLFGDAECGKSSFLRVLATSITRRFAPEEARLIMVDYRRSLLGAIDSDHLIGYGTTAATTGQLIESVDGYMRRRLPGPDVTPQQLRDRSWWTGPELFVLVDDYDLVAAAPVNPLLPLVEHLAQARDVGLHLVLTRRSGGASRALYEPVIQRLRELASPGLVMSGDQEEGGLVGNVRPTALPPGRGRLVTRKEGVRLVQLAYLPPTP